MTLTARIIGADGRMGQEHAAAYTEAGVNVVDGPADIVSIASPDNTHGRYVIEALQQGSHVFCEKPLCTTLGHMAKIKELSGKQHIAQNFPLRHQRTFRSIKNKCDMAAFGELYKIDACYAWGRTYKLNESWRKTDKHYSLVLGGLIHMIDLVLWITDMDLNIVAVIGCNKSAPDFDGNDAISALARFSNGGICNLTVDGGTGVTQHAHRLSITGTENAINITSTAATDKRACIREFIDNIEKPSINDFRAIETALEIDRWA